MTANALDWQALSAGLLERLSASGLRGLFKLEMRGEPGGHVYLRLGDAPELVTSIAADEAPDAILTADALTLKALLERKMSVADGFVSERLQVAGDLAKIVAMKRALALEANDV